MRKSEWITASFWNVTNSIKRLSRLFPIRRLKQFDKFFSLFPQQWQQQRLKKQDARSSRLKILNFEALKPFSNCLVPKSWSQTAILAPVTASLFLSVKDLTEPFEVIWNAMNPVYSWYGSNSRVRLSSSLISASSRRKVAVRPTWQL